MESLFDSKRKTLIAAIALNLVIFAVLVLLGDVRYESNDDFSISNQIADGWYYVSFVNYYLCAFVGWLDSIFTSVNCFILLQVVISFVTLVTITYIVFDSKKGMVLNALYITILGFISIDQYLSIQFTKTAALMLICGFLMMFHGFVISKSKSLVVFGFVWMFLGSAFRHNNLRAAVCFSIAFLGAYSLWYVIDKKWDRQEIKHMAFTACKLVVLLLVMAGLAAGANHFSKAKNLETKALQDYREYNKYRARVLDYPLPAYEDNVEKYQKIDFENRDVMMLKDKFLDYDRIASLDNLKYLSNMQTDTRKTLSYSEAVIHFAHYMFNSIRELRRPFFHILLLLAVTILGFVFLRKRWLVYPVLLGAACILAYIYLFHFGRTVYRAVYIIDLAGMIFLFYSLRFSEYKEKYEHANDSGGIIGKRTATVIAVVLICIPLVYTVLSERHWNDLKEGVAPVDSDKMYDEIMSNKDKTYIITAETSTSLFQKNFKYYKNPYLRQPVMENYMSFGGWSTKSPYKEKKIKKNGLKNLYSDIIDNDKVVAIINLCKFDADGKPYMMPYVQNYFNDRYGSKDSEIRFVNTGKVGGFYLWQIKRFKVKENRS